MALDHYVSQVHLRKFYSPPPDERLYAIRKTDGHAFRARARDVCRIEENSTNPFLSDARAIEEFLRLIEPGYNDAISNIRAGNLDSHCVLVVAGFAAYVSTCSPAAMRLHSAVAQDLFTATAKVLDAAGQLPAPPDMLDRPSITELLEQGRIQARVDPKFPQALGIGNILKLTSNFGNGKWEILRNVEVGSPFFTSDYPIALDANVGPTALGRIVPLAPDLAVRILPDPKRGRDDVDLTFSGLEYQFVTAPRAEICRINTLLVRCAERLVFYCAENGWTKPFIEKNRGYRTEMMAQQISANDGLYHIFGHSIQRSS